jgi:hypothetical protein
MYELLSSVDFSKKRNNPEKDHLKKLFIEWLNRNYPDVNTVDTYFTDAIFIGNNSSLGLNIVEVISDEDEGRTNYHSALVKHFESKGYDSATVHSKAKEYLNRFDQLKEFLDDYEKYKQNIK